MTVRLLAVPGELADPYEGLVEDTRLTRSAHGRLEFMRTQELLRRFLPAPPGRVLDVGGGTGVHAAWLAAEGFDVHVVDPVEQHVAASAAHPGVTAELGDARHLAAETGRVDAVLLLGPLYHLPLREDRITALQEATRVTRPRGLVCASVISRYLSLLELGADGRLTLGLDSSVANVVQTGDYDGHVGFVRGHWHTADELREEMILAGLAETTVFGVEGPAWPALDAAGLGDFDRRSESAARCARIVEQDPMMINASAHLLGVGRVVVP